MRCITYAHAYLDKEGHPREDPVYISDLAERLVIERFVAGLASDSALVKALAQTIVADLDALPKVDPYLNLEPIAVAVLQIIEHGTETKKPRWTKPPGPRV